MSVWKCLVSTTQLAMMPSITLLALVLMVIQAGYATTILTTVSIIAARTTLLASTVLWATLVGAHKATMERTAKQRSTNVHQTPALTTEPALIRHPDTNASVQISLLAKTAKTLQTSAFQHFVKMEVRAILTTQLGASLVHAKLALLVPRVNRILMTVSRVLACQTRIVRIWRMVTAVSVTLPSLEILAISVSSKVFFNINASFTKPGDSIILEISRI